jgi:hypothetical protein
MTIKTTGVKTDLPHRNFSSLCRTGLVVKEEKVNFSLREELWDQKGGAALRHT